MHSADLSDWIAYLEVAEEVQRDLMAQAILLAIGKRTEGEEA